MAYFPMMVSLENRPVLVVGGGAEGLKKVRVLHDFGARITLRKRSRMRIWTGRNMRLLLQPRTKKS